MGLYPAFSSLFSFLYLFFSYDGVHGLNLIVFDYNNLAQTKNSKAVNVIYFDSGLYLRSFIVVGLFVVI